MPLTTAQQVRNRINDPIRYDTEVIVADGMNSTFKLRQGAPYSTIVSGTPTAYVSAAGGWSATGGVTFDLDLGLASFSSAPAANLAINTTYQWSVFSDDQMAIFTAQGAVPNCALLAVKYLLGDYAKRGRWAAPDGSNYDDTMAFKNLIELRSALIDETRGSEVGPLGYSVNWAESQQDYN